MNTLHYFSVIALALAVSTHAEKQDVPPQPKKAYEKAAKVTDANVVTELVFENDSSTLTADAQRHLADMVETARAAGKPIEEIKVLAWADKNYPPKPKKDLSKDARMLADNRGLEVRGFLQSRLPGTDIDVHNMAERPHVLENLFNTQDARVKRSLSEAGLLRPEKGPMPTRESRVMVMFLLRE